MLTRLTQAKERIDRLGLGPAFRYSRNIAGGSTGTFFALKNICQLPVDEYLFGYGPAATTMSIALTVFVTSVIVNQHSSIPNSPQWLIREKEKLCSIEMIVNKLRSDSTKMNDFLKKYKIKADDITRLENWAVDNGDDIQAVIDTLYNHISLNMEKYPISIGFAMMQMAAHFVECMLIQVFVDPHYFDYGNQITVANFMFTLIMFVALYNGMCQFLDVKHSYEHPSSAKLYSTIFSAYDRYSVKEVVNAVKENSKEDGASKDDSPENEHPQVCFAV